MLCDRAHSEPAPYYILAHDIPVPKVVPFPIQVLVSAGVLARQGHRGAGAEDMDPQESRLFTSTAHRTTCFLPFTVVYKILNPRISSMINIPSRTLI